MFTLNEAVKAGIVVEGKKLDAVKKHLKKHGSKYAAALAIGGTAAASPAIKRRYDAYMFKRKVNKTADDTAAAITGAAKGTVDVGKKAISDVADTLSKKTGITGEDINNIKNAAADTLSKKTGITGEDINDIKNAAADKGKKVLGSFNNWLKNK